jgi:hypothetical protein
MLPAVNPQPDKSRAQLARRDTLGTLRPSGIEIIALFLPAVPRVMGRKAPRKRLACRVMACPTGASHAPERLSALRPPLDWGERSKSCKPGRKNVPRERDGLFDMVNIAIGRAAISVRSSPRKDSPAKFCLAQGVIR